MFFDMLLLGFSCGFRCVFVCVFEVFSLGLGVLVCCRGGFKAFLALSTLHAFFWYFRGVFVSGVFSRCFFVGFCGVFSSVVVGVSTVFLVCVFVVCFRAAFVQELEEHSSAFCRRFGPSPDFGASPRCPCIREELKGNNFQDKFDHDKGQKSAISGRRLHWRLSTGFFAFSPVSMCNLARRAP